MSDPTDKDAVPAAAGGDSAAEPKPVTGAESAAEKLAADEASRTGTESGAAEKSAAAEKPAAAEPAAAGKSAAAESTTETPRAVASPTAGAAAGGDATRAKTSTAEAEGESSPTAAKPEGKLSRPVIALAATAVLLVAAIATSITLFIQNSNHTALEDARAEAQQAACTYAPVLAEYDAKNLDAYFQGVLDGATGDWKQQFADTSKELRDVLSKGEVISKADDVQCAIKSADETSAEAIVVIGQTITSLGTQGKPAPGQLSMVMRLQKIDGRWLVNNVNSPLAPNQP